MYQNILFDNTDGVVRISLNRPEVHHALNADLLLEVTEAVKAAEADPAVRVVVLTAEGNKAFCSGADLKESVGAGKSAGELLRTRYNPLILALRNIPKPVICRLNGLAVGAGVSLVLACDVVIASEEAYLSQIFVQIGLMPDAGSTFFLPRLIGMAKAFELASTGRKVYAPEATQMGMISRAVAEAELDSAVDEIVAHYRHAPTKAIGAMKLAFNQSYESSLDEMLALEAKNQDLLSKTNDVTEGIMSFLQKRKPDYQGK